ncbi:MAG: PDZ domain-containing protein [Saprospiraceae bacterium]|nr:PDZ domain-containing protein [Saprospiraceae bacterium]
MNFDFVEAAKIVTPTVVNIEAKQTKAVTSSRKPNSSSPFDLFFGDSYGDYFNVPKQGTGSGVIYAADGYIVTNNHVVEFADDITVTLSDNRSFKAQKVGTYPEADLAILKIEATGLPTLELANSDNALVGEWVLAVGNPFNLISTVTAGIISAKGRDINAIRDESTTAIESFIQTDAAVNPGNSGGALVDAKGRLLGINTAIATQTGTFSGYSFAIPINLVKRIADDIIENGTYQRAMLGVTIFPLDNEYVTENNLNFSQGLVVQEVIDGGSAQYAGLLPKDIIVAINEKPVTSFPELQEAISTTKVNEVVKVKVYRAGDFEEVAVKMLAQKQ